MSIYEYTASMTTSALPLFVVGIDVGGTNTDAVLLEFGSSTQRAHLCDPRAPAPSSASTSKPSPGAGGQVRLAGGRSARLVASVKVPTTACFTGGIHHAIVELLGCLREKKSGSGHTDEEAAGDERNVVAVMIGTTVFLNALLQAGDENAPSKQTGSSGRQLSLGRVACVRLCGPLTRGLPPFSEFPNGLAAAVKGPVYFVDGGFEFDQQIVKPLDERQLRAIGEQLVELSNSGAEDPNRGLEVNVAITGVFSPLYCEQEVRAAEVIGEVLRGAGVEHSITLSHRIGNLSFLERENATILNAALRPLARRTIRDLRRALHELGLVNALQHVYLTQNDGTVFSLEEAVEYPILTLNSGPVNSVRGAAALSESGVHDALVADIGGTSTDVAVLVGSFPRPAGTSVEVAGVRTNFRMPDTHSIALGGGSLVAIDPQVAIGPVSVGNQLFQQAICFGGRILTLTDVAIASGITRIDGADAVRVNVRADKLAAVEEEMLRMLERAVDKMKTSREPVPLILVGGGSALVREGVSLKGVSAIVRPPHFDVANAVGAAIGQLSASVEQVVDLTGLDSGAISRVKHEIEERARNAVIEKGAQPDGIEVITDKIHLTYVIGQCVRFVCKAIGNLDIQKWAGEMDMTRSAAPNTKRQQEPASFELHEYRPPVARPEVFSTLQFTDPIIEYNRVTRRREWVLRAEDIEYMALGAGILACSGGGSPHIGKLEVLRCLSGSHSQSQPLRIIALESLADDEVTLMCSCYGAPLMMIERLPSAEKLVRSVLEMKTRFDLELPDEAQRERRSDGSGGGGGGNGTGKRRRLAALVCAEIGGMNSLEPLRAAALLGLPVLDVDLMGRAFPQLQMCTSFIYGECPLPCALSGEYGDVLVLTEAEVCLFARLLVICKRTI